MISHLQEIEQPPTGAFVLLGQTNSVFHRSVRYSAFVGLTLLI
jgi:hypothetical protein